MNTCSPQLALMAKWFPRLDSNLPSYLYVQLLLYKKFMCVKVVSQQRAQAIRSKEALQLAVFQLQRQPENIIDESLQSFRASSIFTESLALLLHSETSDYVGITTDNTVGNFTNCIQQTCPFVFLFIPWPVNVDQSRPSLIRQTWKPWHVRVPYATVDTTCL